MNKKLEISVFVIEDDPIFTAILTGLLDQVAEHFDAQAVQISCRSFYSAREARYELHQNPEIILLDYYLMDDMLQPETGLQIVKDIKNFAPELDLIIVSGQSDPQLVKKLLEMGVTDYISKEPEAMEKLEKLLVKLVDKRLKHR